MGVYTIDIWKKIFLNYRYVSVIFFQVSTA